MAKPAVSLPQGTRDFNATVIRKRNYIFQTIRHVFETYGFEPLETPAIEQLDTLLGKYGEEGDKLIFRILNNGLERPEKEAQARTDFEKVLKGQSTPGITERALRYDLTIPFARYVAQHHAQLVMPFRRYQMQPVWRADRPQKGRYREFYQCDADIVGSRSLLNEAELASIYASVFNAFKLPVSIHINSRKILAALAEKCGGPDRFSAITVAIDKLEKVGAEKVREELEQKGLSATQISLILDFLTISGTNEEKLNKAAAWLSGIPIATEGIQELETLIGLTQLPELTIDFTLARGLNYYTGIIFEVKAKGVQMGSIGGGGRYDNLTGLFGVDGIPGVGISFGVDRIYDVLEELGLFPTALNNGTKILFFNLGAEESREAFKIAQELRKAGIACELYPEHVKLDKQFKYAERKAIPYVAILGTQEIESGIVKIKELGKGIETSIPKDAFLNYFLGLNA